MRKIDLTGQRFGKLTVIRECESKIGRDLRWVCVCDCNLNKEIIVQGNNLRSGNTSSCGCIQKETMMKLKTVLWEPIECENYFKIPLSKDCYAIIDKDEISKIIKFKWYINKYGYAVTKSRHYSTSMHRLITDCPEGFVVDHVNHNTLDNRKENLRICNQADNTLNQSIRINNTSGCIGVSWCNCKRKWVAYITKDGKHYNLGGYDSFDEAVQVRCEKAKELFGEFYNSAA